MRKNIADLELIRTIALLKRKSREERSPIWRTMAEKLDRSNKRRISVNLSLINRHSKPDDLVTVPGKVLGAGRLDHPVRVSAFRFSKTARHKIEAASGECISISALLDENPKGSGVKMLG